MSPALARRNLVAPAWLHLPEWVLTYGPEVCDVCAAAGFEPYPEQAMMLDAIFAVASDGRAAAFENVVIASRQQLKTGLIIQAKIGWLYVTEDDLIVYSAHNGRAVIEAFRKTTEIITRSPLLSKRLRPGANHGILSGKGDESIELRSGQRILYLPRTKDNGRSLTGNKIVLDEGFAVTPEHVGSLYPTLTAVADPQVLIASSGGKVESEVLRDARDRGRAGLGDRQAFAEWGDPEAGTGCGMESCTHSVGVAGCALDDEDRWARIMPRLSQRRLETVRKLRQSMVPAEFAREFLVWWDDPPADRPHQIVAAEVWGRLWAKDAKDTGRPALAIDVTPSKSVAAIGSAAAMADDPDRILLDVARIGRGTGWVVAEMVRLKRHRPVDVCLDPTTPAGALVPDLEAAGFTIRQVTARDVGQACGAFVDKAEAGILAHLGQQDLTDALTDAGRRDIGDAGLWKYDRRGSAPLAPLYAVTLALHGYLRTVNREVRPWAVRR